LLSGFELAIIGRVWVATEVVTVLAFGSLFARQNGIQAAIGNVLQNCLFTYNGMLQTFSLMY
jgi:hypothetical protein